MQKGYEWLLDEPAPKMLVEMVKLYGTIEAPGPADNPVITGWAVEVEEPAYKHDLTPWCGLAISVAAKRAGWDFKPNGNALWALNWALWQNPASIPMLGDVLTFKRDGGGHVALYAGEDDTHFHIIGGNQRDALNIVRKAKTELYKSRRPAWKVEQPANVRRIFLSAAGAPVAGSEA